MPRAAYRVYVLKISNAPARNGNPMTTLTCQILAPDKIYDKMGAVIAEPGGVQGDMRLVFSEKNLANVITAMAKLGVELPPAGEDLKSDIALMQEAIATQMQGMTFETVVESKRTSLTDSQGNPIKDSLGREIQGGDFPDFNSFNIVGIPLTLDACGITPQPY